MQVGNSQNEFSLIFKRALKARNVKLFHRYWICNGAFDEKFVVISVNVRVISAIFPLLDLPWAPDKRRILKRVFETFSEICEIYGCENIKSFILSKQKSSDETWTVLIHRVSTFPHFSLKENYSERINMQFRKEVKIVYYKVFFVEFLNEHDVETLFSLSHSLSHSLSY